MEKEQILQTILEQLNSLYELDDDTLKNTYTELSESSDEKLTEVLEKLLEFRTKQLQNVHAFNRVNNQEKTIKKEEEERKNLDMNLDF
ncbi:MAG: hypothetical protein PHN60_00490 [Candidatus Gracilibacteria bacterium]|nr:hypothetical protein [Candidatus Gracilibacteria bacterium]